MKLEELEEAERYFSRLFEIDEKVPYDFEVCYMEARGRLMWTKEEAESYIRKFVEKERKRK